MSLLRRLRQPAGTEERSTINLSRYIDLWKDSNIGYGYSPVPVSVQSAMTHSASSACVDVLATSLSTAPMDAVRKVGGARLPVEPAPQLVDRPSVLVENDVWLYQLAESMLTDGNGFAYITQRDALERPRSLDLLDPTLVVDRRITNGVPNALVDGERMQLYPFGDLWHVPGKNVHAGSPFAESTIRRAASTIGAAIAARDYSARFYGQGAHPTMVVYSDTDLTPEQAQALKSVVARITQGSREPLVAGSGTKIEPFQSVPDETTIDLMRFAIEEACRFWRVPPSMVYAAISGQNVTYANVSQADLHYLKHSLEWLLVRLERALSRLLTRPVFVVFNRDAILRSDPEGRSVIVDRRLRNKTLTVNEARALEDQPPFGPEYDAPGIPGEAAPTTAA